MEEGGSGCSGSREAESNCVRVLCRRRITAAASSGEPSVHWLIGSPLFLPPFTVVSIVKCLHWDPSVGPESIDFTREADDLKTLLLRGLDVIGALFVGNQDGKENASKAIAASVRMQHLLFDGKGSCDMIGAAFDMFTKDVNFFVSGDENSKRLEALPTVVYEDHPEKYLWERGCLLKCDLAFKLPIYVPIDKNADAQEFFSSAIDAATAKFRDPKTMYIVEVMSMPSEETIPPVVLHGAELDLNMGLSTDVLLKDSAIESTKEALECSIFFSKSKRSSTATVKENADIIQISLFSNQSENIHTSGAPLAEYFPAPVPATCCVANLKLDILCYAAKNLPLASAISKLIIPGLIDQLFSIKKAISPKLLLQHPKLCPYHFLPGGSLHPITAIYDLAYGEMEMNQVEIRRSLHQRLGLPLDRPLLLIANALIFGTNRTSGRDLVRNGSTLLKDVHSEIPSSGVSGGLVSLVEGSYEYHHYLQDGFDDNGWGCAYRSLQTIISWFKLQHYTSIEVPSHREIQQALVEIGDKEPAFVGSREWIGAIELSFVLDKLLGVSCKVINVRSGLELPEKCRELALHFETQGTPVMIGGGVLAYTLLGVDYNDASGDCAFLILDPHYTGIDEHKRIVNGGWCGWKKPVDSRGKNFFLSDKFYNLLLPQRPKMV